MRSKRKNTKMRNRVPILVGVAVVVVLVAIVSSMKVGYDEPVGFVSERTFSTQSDSLFEYEITRYASGATVISPTVDDDRMSIGLDADPEDLEFGVIPQGENNFAKRFIDLANLNEEEAKVEIVARGDIAPHVRFSSNEIVLGPNQEVKVDVIFHTVDASEREYTGEIDVIIKRPKFDFAKSFW